MNFQFPAYGLLAFMLGLVRASAWAAVAPPLNSKVIPVRVKTGIAAALAIAAVPHIPADKIPTELAPFIGAVLVQVFIGLILGFLAQLFIMAIQTAGALIDVLGGFSISQALDPLLNMQNSIMGRIYALLATTLLFATGGHLILIKGFLNSFDLAPLRGPSLNVLSSLLVHDLGIFALSALEIAGPLVAALLLAEVVMGVVAKAAPQMNVFMLSLPFKILVVILLVGFAIPLLPDALNTLLGHAVNDGGALLRAGAH